MKLFDDIEKDLNRLGVKYSLTREEMHEILTMFFDDLKNMITDPRMPKILITNLGTFYPSLSQINKSLKTSFFWRRLGRTSDETLSKLIKLVWKVRKRLQKEKLGGVTFKEWHQKNYPGKVKKRHS